MKKDKPKGLFDPPQLHAGEHPRPMAERGRDKVWHTNDDGTWWTGYMASGLTTQELLDLSRSIEADLLRAFPDLK